MKVRNRKGGVEEGGGELRGQRREKEMTVRAGRGWAKEASTERGEPPSPGIIFSLLFCGISESTTGLDPQKYLPALLKIKPTL